MPKPTAATIGENTDVPKPIRCPYCGRDGEGHDFDFSKRFEWVGICEHCAELVIVREDAAVKLDCETAVNLMLTGAWLRLAEDRQLVRQQLAAQKISVE